MSAFWLCVTLLIWVRKPADALLSVNQHGFALHSYIVLFFFTWWIKNVMYGETNGGWFSAYIQMQCEKLWQKSGWQMFWPTSWSVHQMQSAAILSWRYWDPWERAVSLTQFTKCAKTDVILFMVVNWFLNGEIKIEHRRYLFIHYKPERSKDGYTTCVLHVL